MINISFDGNGANSQSESQKKSTAQMLYQMDFGNDADLNSAGQELMQEYLRASAEMLSDDSELNF